MIRSPQSLLFSRQNTPTSLSLSSQQSCCDPSDALGVPALHWLPVLPELGSQSWMQHSVHHSTFSLATRENFRVLKHCVPQIPQGSGGVSIPGSAPKNEYTWHSGVQACGYGDSELKVGLPDLGGLFEPSCASEFLFLSLGTLLGALHLVLLLMGTCRPLDVHVGLNIPTKGM